MTPSRGRDVPKARRTQPSRIAVRAHSDEGGVLAVRRPKSRGRTPRSGRLRRPQQAAFMRWVLTLALSIALVSAIVQPAFAYPLLPPHPVPSAIAGPTDPVVASVFYNPAALGPLRGFHFYADAAARLHLGAVDRSPIEGRPGGSDSIVWVNPQSFAGVSWDFYTDRVTVALAGYAPFMELSSYG